MDFIFQIPKMEKLNALYNDEAYYFIKALPNYKETSLIELSNFAKRINVKNVFVKDESKRLDLNAFKILGAMNAIYNILIKHFNLEGRMSFEELVAFLKKKHPLTFITATDGNHGKAVAKAAKIFSQNAIVYLPKGAVKARLDAILTEGAKAEILDINYDQTVAFASKEANENNYILVQDTALDNYYDIPTDIMRGYQTIVFELNNQLSKKVSHIILQAGVGSFAGSFIDAFVNIFDYTPKFIIVEPKNANCYFNSAVNKECCTVKGDLKTIMAGLACGEPNKIAYPIINNFTSCYISASDDIAKKGMQLLAKPIEGDKKINSGESGAIGIGVINEIMTNKKYASVREKLSLNNKSTILVVNTEGITDPDNYEKIIAELD